MKQLLIKLKSRSEELNFGRDEIVSLSKIKINKKEKLNILDIGAGHGTDLINVANIYGKNHVDLTAVENYRPNILELELLGIKVLDQDIEREKLKLPDASIDLIIANQIIEHTKEIFWIFSEISRVLKPGGKLIIGVPNLASFHNRIALFFGFQPTAITVLGAHVRGFTYRSFKEFIECDGYFKVTKRLGSNFYPLPPRTAKILARVLPSYAVGMFLQVERTSKEELFINVLENRFFETPYKKNNA